MKVKSIKQWISAPDWNTLLEQARSKRFSNTGTWVLKEPVYQRWRTDGTASIMSIHGRWLNMKGRHQLIKENSEARLWQDRSLCNYY
jgi:hypothetical protein